MKSISTPVPGNYEFLDEMGDTLRIKAAADGGAFILNPDSDLRFPNAEAPAVALAILTAAGWPGDYPGGASHQILADLRRVVEITGQEVAKKELTRRRDELAKEVAKKSDWSRPDVVRFADLQDDAQTAIDMIIQLQDEATK